MSPERFALAHGHHDDLRLDPADTQPLKDRAGTAYRSLLVVGAVAVLVAVIGALVTGNWTRFGFSYVVAYAFALSLGLGSLFFVMVTHLFRAGWVVAVRRPAETYAATLPVLGLLFLPIAAYVVSGTGTVYPWAQPMAEIQAQYDAAHHAEYAAEAHGEDHQEGPVHGEVHAGEDIPGAPLHDTAEHGEAAHGEHPLPPEMIAGKRPYLNTGFFLVRWVLYFAVWGILGYFYWSTSVRQDHSGEIDLTRQLEKWSPVGLILFAVTITLAGVDLLMSLDPVWFSTMWGVYYFSGAALGTFALLILTILLLQNFGLAKAANREHLHDLGKLLFAFVFFWGYIAFSQYMLIWYANIPEETLWYDQHGLTTVPEEMNAWTWVAFALLLGHLLIPFAGLLSRHVKRNRMALGFWACWLLVMHAMDLWWVVMPSYDPTEVPVPWMEALLLVGLTSLFLSAAMYRAAWHPLVPVRDPRLHESLAFENV